MSKQRVDVIIDPTGDHHVRDKQGVFDLNISSMFRLLTGQEPPTAMVPTRSGAPDLEVIQGGHGDIA